MGIVFNNGAVSAHRYLAGLPWVKVELSLGPAKSQLVHVDT